MRGKDRKRQDRGAESEVIRPTRAEIEWLARRQHGLVTRRQLLERGVDRRTIQRRITARRLIRVRRGIYRLGPIRQPLEAEMAAILACRGDAVLSHGDAVALHGLPLHRARRADVQVTVTGADQGRKPGIRIHRTKHMPADEVTRLHRIPVTTVARTMIDVAPTLSDAALEQLVAAEHRHRPAHTKALHTLIARYPRRPGVRAIGAIFAGGPQFTRSKPERRLLEALRRAGFDPEANTTLAGYEVDLLLPDQRVVIEVDGDPFHSARPDRRRDHVRDAELQALGYAVIRVDADEPAERVIALVAGIWR